MKNWKFMNTIHVTFVFTWINLCVHTQWYMNSFLKIRHRNKRPSSGRARHGGSPPEPDIPPDLRRWGFEHVIQKDNPSFSSPPGVVGNRPLRAHSVSHGLHPSVAGATRDAGLPPRAKLLGSEGTVNDRLAFKSISCYVRGAHSLACDLWKILDLFKSLNWITALILKNCNLSTKSNYPH